jgi:hypothetical protein
MKAAGGGIIGNALRTTYWPIQETLPQTWQTAYKVTIA